MNSQLKVATENMINWLSHPSELGRKPIKIECVGEFNLHDLKYYMFKFKKSLFGSWLLGVCGGYEENELDDCGHTFSEFTEYNPATAEKNCIEMVEAIRAYWINQASLYDNANN